MWVQPRDWFSLKMNFSRVRSKRSTDYVEGGGFSCAVWANEGCNFAFFCRERAVFHSVETAKRFIDVMDGQHNIKKVQYVVFVFTESGGIITWIVLGFK